MRLAIGLVLIAFAVTGFSWATLYYPARFSSIWEFLLNNQFATGVVLAYIGYLIDLLRRADAAARQLEALRSYIYFAVQDRLNKELRLRENLWSLLFRDENVKKFVHQHINNILGQDDTNRRPDKVDEIAKLVADATPKIAEHLETFQIVWDGGLAGENFVLALADVSPQERRLVLRYINKSAEYSDRTKLAIIKSRSIIEKLSNPLDAETVFQLLVNLYALRQTSAELAVDGIEIIRVLTEKEAKLRQLAPSIPKNLNDANDDGDTDLEIKEKFDELPGPEKFKDRWRPFIKFSN